MYETLAAFCQGEAYLLSGEEFVYSGKETFDRKNSGIWMF